MARVFPIMPIPWREKQKSNGQYWVADWVADWSVLADQVLERYRAWGVAILDGLTITQIPTWCLIRRDHLS